MKTPEELAEDYFCIIQLQPQQRKALPFWKDAFVAGYEMGQIHSSTQPKWISVEERLPRPGQEVLAFDDGIFRVQAISSNGTWHPYPNGRKCKPSHWCELPEPPKENE